MAICIIKSFYSKSKCCIRAEVIKTEKKSRASVWNNFPFLKNRTKSEKYSKQKIQWRISPTRGQQNLINNQYSIWFFFLNGRKSEAFRSDLLSLVSAHFEFGYYYLLMMKSWILSTEEKEMLNDFFYSLFSLYLMECSFHTVLVVGYGQCVRN